jgi:hypothetical protein
MYSSAAADLSLIHPSPSLTLSAMRLRVAVPLSGASRNIKAMPVPSPGPLGSWATHDREGMYGQWGAHRRSSSARLPLRTATRQRTTGASGLRVGWVSYRRNGGRPTAQVGLACCPQATQEISPATSSKFTFATVLNRRCRKPGPAPDGRRSTGDIRSACYAGRHAALQPSTAIGVPIPNRT